ncbi:hypothetical protein OG455_00330 [Kitasatospora sp. NBC_01287]|uniref:hypothetical protein n=1 Tax=Kitasatospora sp. NBC_01287 TaxID=2903573 RepID=UPI002251948A|nr:hypothetical protein [Kitasatospora sp. NBC_01287]MCX4743972.1 hypothetical protein [Kitasatospora sp. NBC_01287]
MRVKLRPDAHYAPVPQGVYWARGDRSFVLSGPPALFTVVDDQLDALLDGTSVDEMVAATGDERARPVLEHVVRTLVTQDVLIDLDAVQGPLPDRETAREHAGLLSYLEANCAEPYRAFAAVRAARVAVAGGGPGADAVRRGLVANGTGETTELHLPPSSGGPSSGSPSSGSLAPDSLVPDSLVPDSPAPSSVVVLIDDCDAPLDLLAAAALLAPGTAVLPVAAEPALALVGPVCTTPRQLRAFEAVRARAADWQRTGAEPAAPRPVSAVLAGSLAAHAVLAHLAHLAGAGEGRRTAWVVHGSTAQTRVVPVPDAEPGPAWRPVDLTEALATAERRRPEEARPFELDAALTTRWTGLLRWGRDLDLPQLPVSLVTAEPVAGPGPSPARTADRTTGTPAAAPGPSVLGWGRDRAAAGLTAALAALRHHAGQEWRGESVAGLIPAAGLTQAHWLVDGLLRQAGASELARSAGTALPWDEVGSIAVRSQWGLLRDFFDVPAELRLRTVAGLDWQLVSVTDETTGEVLATQWGPSPASAAYAALLAATARAQFRAAGRSSPQARVLPPDPVGTWSLEIAAEHEILDCLRRLLARAQALGLRPRARRLAHDAVLGELSPACGWVALG